MKRRFKIKWKVAEPRRPRRAKKKTPKPKVKKVVLPAKAILQVVAPKGIMPLVVPKAKGVVEIIPVKHVVIRKRAWWDIFS